MTRRKLTAEFNQSKPKKNVSTRAAGARAFANPADELFAAAFNNPDKSLDLPSSINDLREIDSFSSSHPQPAESKITGRNFSDELPVSTDYTKFASRRLRRQKGLRLPVQKLEKWELWCFLNKIDFQDAVEIAMDWLVTQPLEVTLSDFPDEEAEKDQVLSFYRKWTANNIKLRDREARKDVIKYSVEVCQIGIIQAIIKAPAKINSFAYCVPVISQAAEEMEAAGVTDFKGYLKYLVDSLVKSKK